jgi:2-haloacid dehalogenase
MTARAAARPGAPIEAVVFDLGGVLIDWDPRHLYRKLLDDEEMERFLATVCTADWNRELDGGRSFAEAVNSLSREYPDHAELIAAYHQRWDEMLAGAIPSSVSVLDDLRASGVVVHALTNWSAETFGVARQRFPFLAWFDGIVVSGEVGITKPDPGIYRLLFERFSLEPERVVFIDDAPANVEAAAALGMHGIRFTSGQALRAELASLELVGEGPGREIPAEGLDRHVEVGS